MVICTKSIHHEKRSTFPIGRTCAIERRKIKGRREKEEAVLNNTHVEEKK
ncbi:hypothetical protein MtrunA17_Chr1g0164861 [Medicago truncatula]|uniref:Uncharacterized protein n=1 Tax=Medicago truncatula TaxID=3880 RepID=A0A396JNU7_MEDTR|nr:hypothetical protein MtrunA17_Chr1g0164861 [Medicago truncatula]